MLSPQHIDIKLTKLQIQKQTGSGNARCLVVKFRFIAVEPKLHGHDGNGLESTRGLGYGEYRYLELEFILTTLLPLRRYAPRDTYHCFRDFVW